MTIPTSGVVIDSVLRWEKRPSPRRRREGYVPRGKIPRTRCSRGRCWSRCRTKCNGGSNAHGAIRVGPRSSAAHSAVGPSSNCRKEPRKPQFATERPTARNPQRLNRHTTQGRLRSELLCIPWPPWPPWFFMLFDVAFVLPHEEASRARRKPECPRRDSRSSAAALAVDLPIPSPALAGSIDDPLSRGFSGWQRKEGRSTVRRPALFPGVEARGIEPRSETRFTTASTCVVHRLVSPLAGR